VKQLLRRYRWWLLVACLALLVVGLLCWPRTSGRFTREQYDRIRLGMTPAEVSRSMGSAPSDVFSQWPGLWEQVAFESNGSPPNGKTDVWLDGSVGICVCYRDGKAAVKFMDRQVPPWKIKATIWFYRLRGTRAMSTAISSPTLSPAPTARALLRWP
jgi:hypothetical protein